MSEFVLVDYSRYFSPPPASFVDPLVATDVKESTANHELLGQFKIDDKVLWTGLLGKLV